ncbi:MAG: DUF5683 domain-containing protein [Bacteroidales bacterium]
MLFTLNNTYSQVDTTLVPVDSTTVKEDKIPLTDSILLKKHNPVIASCLSLIPGAGQIYNKKWWKVPIIYAGLGVAGYFVYDFAHQCNLFKNEFIYRYKGEIAKLNPDFAIYDDENLLALRNDYRRNMEISIAAVIIIYMLNIIDATVDAHLFYFDISDDLSLSIQPVINNDLLRNSFNTGFALKLKF